MPTPRESEDRTSFITRCMSDTEALQDFPDRAQRFAFCQSQYDNGEAVEALNPIQAAFMNTVNMSVEQITDWASTQCSRMVKDNNVTQHVLELLTIPVDNWKDLHFSRAESIVRKIEELKLGLEDNTILKDSNGLECGSRVHARLKNYGYDSLGQTVQTNNLLE